MHLLSSRQWKSSIMATGLAVGLVVTLGCYVATARGGVGVGVGVEGEYEVEGPPPPLQEEVVVERPGRDFIWIGGYWDWDLGRRTYAWRQGRWERPPHAHAEWEPPRYERRGERHYYRHGHWREPGKRDERREH